MSNSSPNFPRPGTTRHLVFTVGRWFFFHRKHRNMEVFKIYIPCLPFLGVHVWSLDIISPISWWSHADTHFHIQWKPPCKLGSSRSSKAHVGDANPIVFFIIFLNSSSFGIRQHFKHMKHQHQSTALGDLGQQAKQLGVQPEQHFWTPSWGVSPRSQSSRQG